MTQVVVAHGVAKPMVLDYHGSGLTAIGLSADGRRAFLSGLDELQVLDTRTGRFTHTDIPASHITMSANRRDIIVSRSDGTLSWWDAQTLRQVGAQISGGALYPLMEDSPDGRTLMVVGRDGAASLYDDAARIQLGVPLQLMAGGMVSFARRGDIAFVQRDQRLFALTLDRTAWQRAACVAAGRNLTKTEWATYVGGTPRATCPQWPAPR